MNDEEMLILAFETKTGHETLRSRTIDEMGCLRRCSDTSDMCIFTSRYTDSIMEVFLDGVCHWRDCESESVHGDS